ncbi:MAG: acylneuraminate cytidylyltransferase [Candidatus Omnitrophica bacterium]|nr:acylneuraminate cytidylyltransferase [Candidatus Omnitrophota bacterium]
MKNKVIAIIPARGGSKGIPRKNIVNFAGKPLLAWSILQAKLSKMISAVYVTSDSLQILEIATKYGALPILRPKKISGDSDSSESALLHALSHIKEKPDYIVFLQATSPLRKPGDIDNAIKKIIKQKADSLVSFIELREFIWSKSKDKFFSLTFDCKNRKRRQELEPLFRENGSIFIFKPEILKRLKNRIGAKMSAYIMEPWQKADIDDKVDLQYCEWLFWKYLAKVYGKYIFENIQLIVYDFDGVMTDNRVFIDKRGSEWVKVNRADGLAVSRIKEAGIKQVILSSEENQVIKKRADKLGLPCLYGIANKKKALERYLEANRISKDKVIFVGNDINDMEAMRYVGYPVATNDANAEVKRIAKIVTEAKGGDGVIRELLDMFKAVSRQ